ncbi:hypothetical protein PR003_g10860 [Phytophthora rubi]|uniref:Uncharacterized protein n=1 Tax=Phytophthora rubi TaxID=129364 RepID=A0A6A4FCE0_9STRA|nr:hypothetical protein PR003_g10860 [Phytophthora rubi]
MQTTTLTLMNRCVADDYEEYDPGVLLSTSVEEVEAIESMRFEPTGSVDAPGDLYERSDGSTMTRLGSSGYETYPITVGTWKYKVSQKEKKEHRDELLLRSRSAGNAYTSSKCGSWTTVRELKWCWARTL